MLVLINKYKLWSVRFFFFLNHIFKCINSNYYFILQGCFKIINGGSIYNVTAQLFSTSIIIRNIYWYYYNFWRSCDTEDCSNDGENTDLITEINYSLTLTLLYFVYNIIVWRPIKLVVSITKFTKSHPVSVQMSDALWSLVDILFLATVKCVHEESVSFVFEHR